ncbi:uncharacterized protein PG986_005512 [Apiospora aurea]|uniref:Uncharacterized protein n=1 Tax=Apiospora aurea TaxID=335848 RepID=A0ABR1QHZ5_9PEZI
MPFNFYLQLLRRANVQARVLVVVGLPRALLRRGGRAARAGSDGHAKDLEARRRAFLRLMQALLEAGLGAVREGHVHRRAVADKQSLWLDLTRLSYVFLVLDALLELEHVEVAGPAAGADVVRLDALEGETQRHVVDDVVEALIELGLAAARGVVARDEEVVGAGLRRAARLPEGLPLAALALARADVPDHVVLGVGGGEARDLLGVRLKAAQGPGRALVHVGGVHGLRGLVLAVRGWHGDSGQPTIGDVLDARLMSPYLARLVLDLGGRVPPALVQVPELVRDVVLVGLRVLGPLAALEHVPLVRLQLLLLLVRVALLPHLQLRAELGELFLGRRASGIVLGAQGAAGTTTKYTRGRRDVETLLGANLGRPEKVALDFIGVGKPDCLVVVRNLDGLGLLDRHCVSIVCENRRTWCEKDVEYKYRGNQAVFQLGDDEN